MTRYNPLVENLDAYISVLKEYEIRLAKIKDATQIGNLSRGIIEYELRWTWTPLRIAKKVKDKNANVVVALKETQVIGFGIMEYVENEAYLVLFGVHPKYQRQGIGTKLIKWLEKTALVSGGGFIYLETRLSNAIGRKFYQKLGYKAIQRIPRYYGGREAAIRLAKDLWLNESCKNH